MKTYKPKRVKFKPPPFQRAPSETTVPSGLRMISSPNFDLIPFPATPETLSSFITLVGYSVKSHRTVNNYLSALRRLHDLSGFDSTAFDNIKVKLTLKGLEKTKCHIPSRKLPITPDMLLKFRSHLDFRNSAYLALWAAFLVGFFTFFRTANLCPTSQRHHLHLLGSSHHGHLDYNKAVRRHSLGHSNSAHPKLCSLSRQGLTCIIPDGPRSCQCPRLFIFLIQSSPRLHHCQYLQVQHSVSRFSHWLGAQQLLRAQFTPRRGYLCFPVWHTCGAYQNSGRLELGRLFIVFNDSFS